ncbi:MAG: SLC13 family permease [Chloroflexota bacterium]
MRLRLALLSVGTLGAAAAVAFYRTAASDSAAHTWPPFVLVAGLLLIGAAANEDGVFAATARLVCRLPGGSLPLYAASMLLVAAVTVVLNLDTSVAFLTPVLLQVARLRSGGEERFLYGCVFVQRRLAAPARQQSHQPAGAGRRARQRVGVPEPDGGSMACLGSRDDGGSRVGVPRL